MASLGRFLLPIRVSFSSLSSFPNPSLSFSKNTFTEKYIMLKTWVRALGSAVQFRAASKCQLNLNMQRKWIHNLRYSGRKIAIRSFLGVPFLIGALQFHQTVSYAFDENEVLTEDHRSDVWDCFGFMEDDETHAFWTLARKCLLPALLILTVVTGWEHPLTLAIKVALFLFSTKPSPISVYLFVEKVRRKSMRQNLGINKSRAPYAKKVEFEDYKLLYLARIELLDKRITLMGILGSWWILQASELKSSHPFHKW